MRVLVIDDHPLIQEIVPAVLVKAFGEVVVDTQSTLEAGIERAAAEPPDLVVLDLGLPGCDGIDAMSRFRMHFPQMPVAVLSARCDREAILGVLDAGASGYIPKTSKPDVMIAALRVIEAGGTYVPPEALDEPSAPRARRRLGRLALIDSRRCCASSSRATVTSASPRNSRSPRTRSSSTRTLFSSRSAYRHARKR